jgi:hypothetical protein
MSKMATLRALGLALILALLLFAFQGTLVNVHYRLPAGDRVESQCHDQVGPAEVR